MVKRLMIPVFLLGIDVLGSGKRDLGTYFDVLHLDIDLHLRECFDGRRYDWRGQLLLWFGVAPGLGDRFYYGAGP